MQLILASQSPRRRFILEEMGLKFKTIPSDYDEKFDQSKPASDVAMELALGKAQAVANDNPDAVVIGSDTIVVLDNTQLGKPADAPEARKMLKAYRNRSHQVITGVAVIYKSHSMEYVDFDIAEVHFDDLPDSAIEEYIATNNPFDKAGAYAIQHPLIRPHILKMEGRADTTIGLPTHVLCKLLDKFGIKSKQLDMHDEKLLKKIGFFD